MALKTKTATKPKLKVLTPKIESSQNPQKPSRITYRVSAYVLDQLFVNILTTAILIAVSLIFSIHIQIPVLKTEAAKLAYQQKMLFQYWYVFLGYAVIGFLASVIFFAYLHKRQGQTPGKKIFGLKVLDLETGNYLTYSKSFIREIVKTGLASIPQVGWLLNLLNAFVAVFTKEKTGVHDMLVKSRVVEAEPSMPILKQIVIFAGGIVVILFLNNLLLSLVFRTAVK